MWASQARSDLRNTCYLCLLVWLLVSRAALAMVPAYRFAAYRLSGTLDRLRKLDMEQHSK